MVIRQILDNFYKTSTKQWNYNYKEINQKKFLLTSKVCMLCILIQQTYIYPDHLFLSDFKNGWQIISPSKSFAVYAATPTEKAEWMAHINKCINDLLKKSKLKFTLDVFLSCYKVV